MTDPYRVLSARSSLALDGNRGLAERTVRAYQTGIPHSPQPAVAAWTGETSTE
jgi:hypothetical protein